MREQLLELGELGELTDGLGGAEHRERVLPGGAELLVPAHVGQLVAEVLAEPVELPGEVHVAHQLLGEPCELGTLLGRHRGDHLRGRGHPAGELLEQLVEVLRPAREQVAVTAP